jgi:hypothetical protein
MTTGFIFGTDFFIWRSFASFLSFTHLGTLGAFPFGTFAGLGFLAVTAFALALALAFALTFARYVVGRLVTTFALAFARYVVGMIVTALALAFQMTVRLFRVAAAFS